MDVLKAILPIALVVFFLGRAYNNRLFLLGIPFLHMMRFSVFFEQLTPFWMPGRLGTAGAMMLWIVIAWLYCSGLVLPRRDSPRTGAYFGPALRLPEEGFLLALGLLVIVRIMFTMLSGVDPLQTLSEASIMIDAIFGYLLVRGCVYHSEREEVASFLKALVVISLGAAILFLLHQGLHVKVYHVSEYLIFRYQSVILTRTFMIMPPLLLFSCAWLLSRKRLSIAVAVGFMIGAAAVITSYTRVIIFAFMSELVVVAILTWMRSTRTRRPFFDKVVRWVVVAAALMSLLIVVLPTGTNYAVSRLAPVLSPATALAEPNVQFRQARLDLVYRSIGPRGELFGAGFRSPIGAFSSEILHDWSADMGWILILYRLGYFGLILLAGAVVTTGVRTARLALCGDPWWMEWGTLWTVALAGAVVWVLSAWSFLNPEALPLSLWMFAFIAGCRPPTALGRTAP